MNPEALAEIDGVMAGIAHKWVLSGLAESRRSAGGLTLRYDPPIRAVFPRQVDYSAELMAPSFAAAAELAHTLLTHPRETHMAYVFGADTQADAAAIDAAGYDPCWTTSVLVRDLTDDEPRDPSDLSMELLRSAARVEELNAAGASPPSFVEAIGDAHIRQVLACREGTALATGMVVVGLSECAYVADMWTSPEVRRQGAGRAVMAALHAEARRAGAKRTVLFPSLMAVQIGFYPALGYRRGPSAAVLVSKAAGA